MTLLKIYKENLIESVHDVSLGGIIVAISKMCINGKKGIKIGKLKNLMNKFEFFFGEDQGRYIIEVSKDKVLKVHKILIENSVHFDLLGSILDKNMEIEDEPKLSIDELAKYNNNWLKNFMIN